MIENVSGATSARYNDHLKNHGFLYVGSGRWRLSPVFDVNPAPDRNPHLETAILEGGAHDRSIRLALEACEFFEIAETDARRMIRETALRISDEWREVLRQVGAKPFAKLLRVRES